MTQQFDVIVVGSGASGVHAAYPLVEAGLRVIMLDVGNEDLTYENLIPSGSFVDVRRSDPNQHRYFLGDRFEGVALGAADAGPQITPPRSYVLKDSQRLAPKRAKNFEPLESFALGGLARAWGAVAFPFQDCELQRCGLPVTELRKHYEIVARRIGVSGIRDDDLSAVRGPLDALQGPLLLDHNATAILDRYAAASARFRKAGMYLGQTLLASLSDPIGNREPNSHDDMDFWSNNGQAVYRPNITLRELQTRPNFSYRSGFFVSEFAEQGKKVAVTGMVIDGTGRETLTARSLVLAAGSLGTTRLVLRSLGVYDRPVSFVCNAHTYMPCLRYRGLGMPHADRCHSLAQLTLMYDAARDGNHLVQAQMYSYRALHLFRLLKETPLPYREGVRIMSALAPSIVIWAIQHEDAPSPSKYCVLRRGRDSNDVTLEIEYGDSRAEQAQRNNYEASIARFVRQLGCLPLKRVHAVHGSSVHYAGQFPLTREDQPLTTEISGRLRGTAAVFLADGSTFAYLPAKGPTLTLMANANRVGANVLESFAMRGDD